MNLEDRITRLEDVLRKLIWNKMLDQDFNGMSSDLSNFVAAINEERIAEQKKSEELRAASENWSEFYQNWNRDKR